jgi:hypothetical protein
LYQGQIVKGKDVQLKRVFYKKRRKTQWSSDSVL